VRRNDGQLRSDAALNRQRILDAASEAFAEHGLDVTLNNVAAYAGVGVGTVYRRFANKDELIDELFERRLDRLADLADAASADPDAWNALTTFLEGSMQLMLEDRGFMAILQHPDPALTRVAQATERVAPLITAIVERARKQGTLRPDFADTDVPLIQLALGALIDRTRATQPQLYRRYLAMFLDGMRADRGPISELPVGAINNEQTAQAIQLPSRPTSANIGPDAHTSPRR
jgi:AcrR family transcriptional regulator